MAQSLAEKLRIKPGNRIAVLNAPESENELIRALPKNVAAVDDLQGSFDQIHVFVRNRAELERLVPHAATSLEPAGLLWIYFPKKASEAQSDLTRDRGWDSLKSTGFSGVSLISLDEIWSAFAFRKRPAGLAKKAAKTAPAHNRHLAKYINLTTRTVKPPPDLLSGLKKNARAAATFNALPFTHRKEYVLWILGAKKAETRARRITATIRLLAKGAGNPRAT
jgi:hypothetical protein